MDKIIIKDWSDVCDTGIVNPYSSCSCCDYHNPSKYIQIGDPKHPAASYQLCEECLSYFKEQL